MDHNHRNINVRNKTDVVKSEEEWTTSEDELSLANSKALNALFNGVDKKGTSKVKNSRIQLLTTKFESLKMNEHETIQDYYMTVFDITNTFDFLGEKLSDEKLVRKIL